MRPFSKQGQKAPLGLGPAGWVSRQTEPLQVPGFQIPSNGGLAVNLAPGPHLLCRFPVQLCAIDWAWVLEFTSPAVPAASMNVFFYATHDWDSGQVSHIYPVVTVCECRAGDWREVFQERDWFSDAVPTYQSWAASAAENEAINSLRAPTPEISLKWKFQAWDGRPVLDMGYPG